MRQTPPPPPEFHAFTINASEGRLATLLTPVRVSLPFKPGEERTGQPIMHQVNALWDTGASGTVITKSVSLALGLIPSSMSRIRHVGGEEDAYGYIVNLFLPNGVSIHAVQVMEMQDRPDFDVLIGMDIITLGDFAITNVGGKTTFSYRVPSTATLDYVKDAERIRSLGNREAPVERNDLCPCGSGRKYKNCHMPR